MQKLYSIVNGLRNNLKNLINFIINQKIRGYSSINKENVNINKKEKLITFVGKLNL